MNGKLTNTILLVLFFGCITTVPVQTAASENLMQRNAAELPESDRGMAPPFLPNTNRNEIIIDLNYEKLKGQIVTMLDTAIIKLIQAINKVLVLPYLSESTQDMIIDGLSKVTESLIMYQKEVSQTTSVAELQELNNKIVQYIKDNKDVIQQNMQSAISAIAGEVATSAEKYKALVEQALKVLKVTCPSQKETISTVEDQLEELEEQINTLQNDAKVKNTTALKQDIQAVAATTQELYSNLVLIQQNCS